MYGPREEACGEKLSSLCLLNPPLSIWELQPKRQNRYLHEMLQLQ